MSSSTIYLLSKCWLSTKLVYARGISLKTADGIVGNELQMIVPVAIDWDSDGDVDLVVGDEDTEALIENTGLLEEQIPVLSHLFIFSSKQTL